VPTLDLQIVASADDCRVRWSGSAWELDAATTSQWVGVGGLPNTKAGGGMRFQSVTIPQGATVTTAYLTLTCQGSDSLTVVNSVIIGEGVDNAAAFSNIADYQARRGTIVGGANDNNITSASVSWNAIPAWTLDTEYNSPEIKTIIQEIVNRAGWASGNALVLFWDDHAGNTTQVTNTRRRGYSYDGSTAKAPKLHIEYATVTAKTSSDSGAGVDSTPAPSASLSGSESGSSIEALAARLMASFDIGTAIEVSSLFHDLFQNLFASELGEGLDLLVAKIEMPTKGGGMKLWT
jgi:hypothetical protein